MKNQSAFPISSLSELAAKAGDIELLRSSAGLNKREYFAVMAMKNINNHTFLSSEVVAEEAVKRADALIKELQKDV